MKTLTSHMLWELAVPYLASFVGSLVVAIGMNAFFIPFHLLSSGLSGVAIMIYFLTGLPVGIGIFILNIPIMIACYKFMGRRYTVLSIVGTIMLSVLVDATAFLSTWNIMHDAMLSSITGGILAGIGFGIIYKYNGNSGGLDVIGAIVKKYYSLEMGTVTMILNLVILLAAAWLFSLERAVLTFVAIYIAAFITNKVVIGLKQRKSVIIISNRATPIAQILMRYVGHGATYLHGQGAYTMQDKRVIYAVIKLTEVAKVKDPAKLGKHIVVQGGTFYNDAVLRAFEKLLGRQVIRPAISGLMGAFGMGLVCRTAYHQDHAKSTIVSPKALEELQVTTSIRHCGLCTNNCLLTVNTFNDGRSFITGNRCERGAAGSTSARKKPLPNMYKVKYNLLFGYKPVENAPRGTVGIPRVLNMYEDYPFWFTFFTKLGYTVVLSDPSSKALFEKAMDTVPSDSACYPAKLVHGHIENLLEKGVDRIFYPCIQNGPSEGSKDNTFNCPMVMSYPEVIRNNMGERLAETNTPYLCPFLPLHDKKRIGKRLAEELKAWNLPAHEIKAAAAAAWDEEEAYKQKIYDLTKKILDNLEKTGQRAIVLCGRPYHIDPEINHGIPELINSLGLAVLTEDGVAPLGQFPGHLRVVDQWSYHSRLYRAAQYITQHPNLELVELNSFGCGLDAIVADQVQDILAHGHKIHTLLKIDEGSNLGAIRIRLRSLLFVMNHRPKEDHVIEPYSYEKTKFTKEDAKQNVILAPSMTPIHFPLFMAAFEHEGYRVELLPHQGQKAIDTGLAYIHNDACYPAIMSLGQIITALKSGKYDLDHTTVMISQTGGCCRATNYIGMIRKALNDANMSQVAILSLNLKGMNKQPGFQPGIGFWHRLVMGMIYGDALQQVLYRTRPYEKVKGTAEALFHKWQKKCAEQLKKADFKSFRKNIRDLVDEFDHIDMSETMKPRIGLVGEIYVKFHPIANNHIVRMIEEEGGEIIVSGLADFFLYGQLDSQFRHKYLSGSWKDSFLSKTAVRLLEWYRKPYEQAVAKSRHFDSITSIYDIADEAKKYLSLGHEAGEGWFLTGDMIDLIHRGAKNIVCLQPWACLPNHVTGKGMIKTLKAAFPETNIVAIDYDPSASSVNQTNRLKLMLTTTFEGIREPVQEDAKPVLPFMSGVRINSSLEK